jgi:hypothetical protein
MKKTTRRYVAGLSVIGALVVIAALAGVRVGAQDVPPMAPTGQFGMMGAIRGEVARLNVSNVNAHPPDPCHAILAFVDASGDVLLRPDGSPVRREVTLAAGQSAFLQFHAANFIGRDETRLNFRPVVLAPPDPSTPPDPLHPPDPCVASLEIIENATGQTRLLTPGVARR